MHGVSDTGRRHHQCAEHIGFQVDAGKAQLVTLGLQDDIFMRCFEVFALNEVHRIHGLRHEMVKVEQTILKLLIIVEIDIDQRQIFLLRVEAKKFLLPPDGDADKR